MRVLLVCALSTTIIAAQVPALSTPGQNPPRDRPVRTRPADVPDLEPRANGIIRGRVVADESGVDRPIVKARVEVSRDGVPERMFTDSSGVFEFSALPAGHYTIFADKSGYAPTRYGAAGPQDAPIAIDLTDGGREELEIRLPNGAVIAGRVVDDLGEALVGARVMVSAIRVEGTSRRLVASPQIPSDTDDQGAFRIGGLAAGRYLLSIVARDRDRAAVTSFTSFDLTSPPPVRRIGSGRTFYPSSATSGEATPIELNAGEERLDVDVVLTPYRPAALTFAVANAPDSATKAATSPADSRRMAADSAAGRSPQTRVVFANQDTPDPVSQDTVMEFSGRTEIYGMTPGPGPVAIDPGSWDVIARRGIDGALAHVTLAPGETQSPVLEIRPASRITGRIVFEGSTRRPDASSTFLDVIGAGLDRNVSPLLLLPGGRVAVKPDGSFSLVGVLGTVEFAVTTPAGWAVSRLAAGDRDLLGTPITFEGGEIINDARIVLTDQVGEIGGSVVGADLAGSGWLQIAVFPPIRMPRSIGAPDAAGSG